MVTFPPDWPWPAAMAITAWGMGWLVSAAGARSSMLVAGSSARVMIFGRSWTGGRSQPPSAGVRNGGPSLFAMLCEP
jgi:hypothetical protein